ncbi:helix-turn-helix domain-containing protein [Gordonia sp. N1V]|uniref:sigma-54-dependent Fis family transcriptional regulator n=1 Tax=Gordonia sp. N1V TaxID=3034163 RepID=UPI001552E4D3|nr:helix-turn-helix domain-containing protein [Gordonia sp. N1V]MDF3281146.1 helix-turn-helix domain-containing protein [Gordonia sp. N1V]
MVDELSDTRFSILLADHAARIVDLRRSSRVADRHLDRAKAVPGATYLEETSGTNSLATAFELRKPIAVAGDEHFLEALRVFCCYGAPIIHPITRRLEGVLDVTGPVEDISNLLGPFLMRAVRDIEQRLHEGSKLSEQRLFAEFQMEAARKKSAIMLFGENLALSNAAAMDLISGDDHPALRALAADLSDREHVTRSLSLASGRPVDVHARLVDESRDGVLIEVVPHETVFHPMKGAAGSRLGVEDPTGQRRGGHITVVIGAPGTGKTTRARELAGVDATWIDVGGAEDWTSRLRRAESVGTPLVVDNAHLSSPREAAILRATVGAATNSVVITLTDDDLPNEHQALAAVADVREERPLLRDAGAEFPAVVRAALDRVIAASGPDESGVYSRSSTQIRITPSAIEALAAQDWPGNLTELDHVLRTALRGRNAGDVTVEDLPVTHRAKPDRVLTPLERAERATIMATLRASDGNKAAAATTLGIGRNTLYQRIRYYGIG